MPELIFTRGLSASGKSTWARQYAAKNPGTAIVCMDDIRAMLGLPFSSENEKLALRVQDATVLTALREGRNVVVANTHLHNAWPRRLLTLVWESGIKADARIEDFTDVPLVMCVERDRARTVGHVGEDVIRKQGRTLQKERDRGLWTVEGIMAQFPTIVPQGTLVDYPALEECVLVDADGTLCDNSWRDPYDASKCFDDPPNDHVLNVVRMLDNAGLYVIILSGRDSKYRQQTFDWLRKYRVPETELLMRAEGDQRRDSIVKYELWDKHVRPYYYTRLAIDDRLRVCQVWHQVGIPLFRVGDPSATF